jgi:hypothetical protein
MVIAAWATFAVALVPVVAYAFRHPGNLTTRYEATTIARDGLSGIRLVLQAVANWAKDLNPLHWATGGDPAPYIHNGGYAAFSAGLMTLAIAGAVLVLVRRRADPWWRYVLLATLLVPIPAALTVDRFNAIRLAVLPVLFLVLAVPALQALVAAVRRSWAARAAATAIALVVVVQFAQFLDEYRTRGPGRVVLFEAGVRPLLEPHFRADETLYLDYDDRGAQAQARWHAADLEVPDERVVILPDGGIPPPGALVLLQFQDCDFECEVVESWDRYRLARVSAG